ncbi:AAA family ATPase [Fulvimonas yonginensis]|uniref:AAA family ATPase n=1 Tax=Fulvimonas yonginensis TaxID=1495200 RepID=A0ABU8J9L1_9GAMM
MADTAAQKPPPRRRPDEAEVPAPNLRAVPVDDIERAVLPRTEYAVADLIPLALVLLGGHGGAGKSILALTIAAHVAAGAPFAGHECRPGRVLFVSLEDDGHLVRFRLKRVCRAYGLDAVAIARNLVLLDGTAGNATLATEIAVAGTRDTVATATFTELQAAAVGARLIVVDNASDAFDANENDRRSVRAFMRLLAGLARANGAAVLLLAHIDKAAARFGARGDNYSGSTAWHNSARARLALLREGNAIELRQEKNNLGPLAEPLRLRWNPDGVLVPTDGNEIDPAETHATAQDNEDVMRCLALAVHGGVTVYTARNGGHTAYAALKTMPEFPAWAVDKSRFWAALTRLDRLGWIVREVCVTPSRNKTEKWAIGPGAPDKHKTPPTWAGSAS